MAQHRESFAEMLKPILFVAAAVQWGERIMRKIDNGFPARNSTHGRTNVERTEGAGRRT